jgi:hypothetical protein
MLAMMTTAAFAFALTVASAADDDDHTRALAAESALQSTAALLRVIDAHERSGDDRALSAFLDDVVTNAKSAVARDRARFERLHITARQGALSRARLEATELGIVPRARVYGPFDNPGGVMIAHPWPFDENAALYENGFVVETDPRLHRFDIGSQLVEETNLRTAIAFVVVADRETDIALRIANAGQLLVRVNGATLRTEDLDRPLTFDQSVVAARVPKGKSLVVIGLGALTRPLEARVRLTALDGARLTGVTTSVESVDLLEAARTKPLPVPTSIVVDAALEIDRFLAHPPLVRAPEGDADPLVDAIVFERETRSRDERLAPKSHEVWLFALRTRVRLARGASGRAPPLADILVDIAESAVEKDPTTARQALDEALALDATHVRARGALAALRDRQGFTRDARTHYLKLTSDDVADGVVHASALRFLRTFSEDRPRIDASILALAHEGAHPEILRLALDVLIERNDLSRALPVVERVETFDEVDAAALRVRLDVTGALLASDDDDERARGFAVARALLEKRVLHHPSSHRDFRRLALVLAAHGEDVAVTRILDERQRAYPLRADVPALRAELALYDRKPDLAREHLLVALSRSPQNADLARTFALLDDADAVLPEDLILDVTAARAMPAPPGADEVGAFVAGRAIYVRTFANGLGTIVEDRVVRVLDAKKTEHLRTHGVPWVDGRERVSVLIAERYTKDGRRESPASIHDTEPDGKVGGVYTDEKTRVITFRHLADGDILHIRTRTDLVGRQNLFGDFFGRVEIIQGDLPVENWVLRITSPKGRKLVHGGRNAPAPTVDESDTERTLTFRVPRAPRVRVEESMPPFLEVADFVSVSTYERWSDLGVWYAALIRDSLFVDDELKSIAHRVVAGALSDEEKVRRIYEYVVVSTRYLGIELGIHGWKPYPVTLVHRRRYGDCKDKASLLYVMLEEVGIPARLVMVRTADIGVVEPEPASMWLFNHAIAYVPSLDLYLDGTAERSGFRELPAMDQGALVVVIDPKGREPARPARIPIASADANLNRSAYLMDVKPDGTVIIEVGEERFRGTNAARERATFTDVATRKERLERSLATVLPGVSLLSLEVSDLSLSTEEVGYRMSAVLPGRATRESDGALVMPLSLYPHDLVQSYARRSDRTQPVWLEAPWKTRNVMRYKLPTGYVATELPTSSVVDAPGFRFEQKITVTSDGFIVDEETTFSARHIPLEDYAAVRDALARADALMRKRVRMVATERGPT